MLKVRIKKRHFRREKQGCPTLAQHIELCRILKDIVKKNKEINEMISYIDGLRNDDIPF